MKIKKIKLKNHKILKDLDIDFCTKDGKILNTIVIIGENGTGKTTLLKAIFNIFESDSKLAKTRDNDVLMVYGNDGISLQTSDNEFNFLYDRSTFGNNVNNIFKVVFMPTEINFNELNKVDNTFKLSSSFINVIDQHITENIQSFIATKINKEIFKNRNKVIGEVIDGVCDEINSVFKIMDLDVKLVGLSEDEETKPIFKNGSGDKFDISGLSSGEKQLFLRALSLKFLDVNNSIILIDEPEISLHPNWQQKIIQVYENIGENNQIIIATHSPHIISNIKSEQLKVMIKTDNKVSMLDNEKIDETYGHTVENILKTVMESENIRNSDIEDKLKNANELLQKNLYETKEFKDLYEYIRKYLGDLDEDIMLINLEISRRKRKNNVKDK